MDYRTVHRLIVIEFWDLVLMNSISDFVGFVVIACNWCQDLVVAVFDDCQGVRI